MSYSISNGSSGGGGGVISPVVQDSYNHSDTDGDSSPQYYGFLLADGGWYILRADATTSRYFRGTTGYVAAWIGRASLAYNYYNTIFSSSGVSQTTPNHSDTDEAGTPQYYGFLAADGSWYIQRVDVNSSSRYSKGTGSYTTAWTGRAALSYDYYDVIF